MHFKMSTDLPSRINFWDDSSNNKNQTNGGGSPPFQITGALTIEQMNAYQVIYRINEITTILNAPAGPLPKSFTRLPSPPPVYDASGKRVNTDEQRYRKLLEDERYRLVETALRVVPFFVPPKDYVKPTKFQEKYYIPVDQYPGVNFVGLLLGPRGNTLRKLQEDSKCKIAIRGRGSVKEGKHTSDLPKGAANMDDPLHCLIIGDTEEKVQNGIKACQTVVVTAVTSPEGQNDLKRGQLRELAELNGTLREDDRPCTICGLKGHLKYDCPNRQSYAQQVVCNNCGQPGHISRDCPAPREAFNSMSSHGLPQVPANSYQTQQPGSRYAPASISRYNNTASVGNNRYGGNSMYQSRYTSRDSMHSDRRYDNTHRGDVSNIRNGAIYSEEAAPHNKDREPSSAPSSSSTPLTVNAQSRADEPTNAVAANSMTSIPPGLDSENILADTNAYNVPPGLEAPNAPPGLDSISAPPGLLSTNAPPGLSSANGPPGLDGIPGLVDDDKKTSPEGLSGPPGL